MWIKLIALTQERRWGSYLRHILRPGPSKAARTRPPDGRPIGVAIIGLGRHAQARILPAIRQVDGMVVRKAVVRRVPGGSGDLHLTDRIDDVWSDPDIHAAVVSVPTSILAQTAVACLRAGLPVYCECPAALSDGDIRVLKSAMHAGGHPGFQVGYHLRGIPEIRSLVDDVRNCAETTRVELRSHSLYHLCDLASFVSGGQASWTLQVTTGGVEIRFRDGPVIDIRLTHDMFSVKWFRGERMAREIVFTNFVPEHYTGMLTNFASTIRQTAAPFCGIGALESGWSLYASVRRAMLLNRLVPTPLRRRGPHADRR